jgi:hypothetical protein
MSALARLSSLLGLFGGNQNSYGVPFSNRNYIVDGNFDSWINSAVTTAAGAVTNAAATMYYCNPGVGGVATFSQQSFVGNEPAGMTAPARYFMRCAQTTAPSGNPLLMHRVESVQTLQGRSATFSLWLRSAAPLAIPQVQTVQNFGTGGSPSASVTTVTPVNWNVTTSWQRLSVLLNVPSIVGATLGTAGNDSLGLQLVLPPNVTFQFDTGQWQLEQSSPNASSSLTGNGGDPTAFEYRGQQAELARVQRYYNVTAPYGVFAASAAAQNWGTYSPYPVPMRAQPALTLLSNNSSGQSPPGTYGFTQAATFGYALVVASGGTGWFNVAGTAAADARL